MSPRVASLFGLFLMLFSAFTGCGESTGVQTNPDPISVKGKVSQDGKPVDKLQISLQPTRDGLPATINIQNGQFEASITPGQYTWYLTAPTNASKSLASVPAAYREGSMQRLIEIDASTSTLDLAVN